MRLEPYSESLDDCDALLSTFPAEGHELEGAPATFSRVGDGSDIVSWGAWLVLQGGDALLSMELPATNLSEDDTGKFSDSCKDWKLGNSMSGGGFQSSVDVFCVVSWTEHMPDVEPGMLSESCDTQYPCDVFESCDFSNTDICDVGALVQD